VSKCCSSMVEGYHVVVGGVGDLPHENMLVPLVNHRPYVAQQQAFNSDMGTSLSKHRDREVDAEVSVGRAGDSLVGRIDVDARYTVSHLLGPSLKLVSCLFDGKITT